MRRGENTHVGIESQIIKTIEDLGKGAVFVPTDFIDLGNRRAIDVALHRLVQKGLIRRLARGIYDFPEEHPTLGRLQPAPEKIAEALVGRDCTRIQPSGAYAANILGLSEQVPAKVVFLTDGPNRTVKIGAMTIQLRRTTPKNMAMAGRLSGLLVQAFREIGKDNMTTERIAYLRRALPAEKRRELLQDVRLVPEWMRSIFRKLAEENR